MAGKTEQIIQVSMTPLQKSLYKAISKKFILILKSDKLLLKITWTSYSDEKLYEVEYQKRVRKFNGAKCAGRFKKTL